MFQSNCPDVRLAAIIRLFVATPVAGLTVLVVVTAISDSKSAVPIEENGKDMLLYQTRGDEIGAANACNVQLSKRYCVFAPDPKVCMLKTYGSA